MVKLKDFSMSLSVFPVLFKANLIFKDYSSQVLFKPVLTLFCNHLDEEERASCFT